MSCGKCSASSHRTGAVLNTMIDGSKRGCLAIDAGTGRFLLIGSLVENARSSSAIGQVQ